MRDSLYTVIPIQFLDLVEDLSIAKTTLKPETIAEAHAVLKEPLSFYSGYIQLSMSCKDEILESQALKSLMG